MWSDIDLLQIQTCCTKHETVKQDKPILCYHNCQTREGSKFVLYHMTISVTDESDTKKETRQVSMKAIGKRETRQGKFVLYITSNGE